LLFQSLPFDEARKTRPGYINTSLFKPTQESFLISELPQHIRDKYNIPRHDGPARSETEINPLPLVNLSGARTNRYDFLATAQDTKFALVPIHTNEEYALFNKAVRPGGKFAASNGPPDFKEMAKWWSGKVNGKKIFFKIPEHLQNHYKVWNAARDEMTTTHMTAEARKGFTDVVKSDAYTSRVLDESYSPAVQTRNAGTISSTSIAGRAAVERRAVAMEAAAHSASTRSLPQASSAAAVPQIVFVDADSRSLPAPSDATNAAVAPRKQPRKPKSCAVCKSKGKSESEARDCRGRGDRRLCKYYGSEGAVGKRR
jgi:hypothetical protein